MSEEFIGGAANSVSLGEMGMVSGSCSALVADDPRLAQAIQGHLKSICQPALVCSLSSAREDLDLERQGLILLVASSPADCGPIVRLTQDIKLRKRDADVFIVIADAASEARLTALTPALVKRLRWPEDAASLAQAVKERQTRYRSRPFDSVSRSLEERISERLLALTPSLASLVERIALAAAHDVTVLLTGGTGTGKTFLARLMHDCSPRKEHRFLTVPCGALAPNLLESEFFGHVKGAFTGAQRAKVGKFVAAGSGTLLLDEIDTLGFEQQAGLLRVIETGELEPIGSNETQRCWARIIVASNINLEEAVRQGKFRQDLYYRLNVMSFHLPPLCERVQDIEPLAREMTARFNRKFGKDLFDIAPETIAALEELPWPGNIRQLENVIQHAVIVSKGTELLPAHLPDDVRDHASAHVALASKGALSVNRDQIERSVIQKALIRNDFNRTQTAKALGVSRVTLFKKMTKYGLMEMAAGQ